MTQQIIVPHLWYDTEAKEAAEFYVAAFGANSQITDVTIIHDTPSGSADIVSFTLLGHDFMSISAGPLFKINPSISFHIKCQTAEEVDAIWEALSPGGMPLMPLGEYPFSPRFGWLQDKYGVSWQIMHTDETTQRIVPALMFTQVGYGQAEAAINFYTSVFSSAAIQLLDRYGEGEAPEKAGAIRYAELTLAGQDFVITESAREHDFIFNEAVSLIVNCKDQAEIDYYWEKLSAVPEAEQCGWVKDKYGVSWQIIPENMGELMNKNLEKLTPVMLAMKKINIAELEAAAE